MQTQFVFGCPLAEILEVILDIFEDDVLDELALIVFGIKKILCGLQCTCICTTLGQSLIMYNISYSLLS